jgi:DnaK suppressor protein
MLSEQQLAELQTLLQSRREQLNDVLESANERSQTVTLDQQSTGRVSRGDALQQQAMALANKAQYERELRQVRAALQRIADEDYGFCDTCGEDIPHPRLAVRPESRYCLHCQNVAEQDR